MKAKLKSPAKMGRSLEQTKKMDAQSKIESKKEAERKKTQHALRVKNAGGKNYGGYYETKDPQILANRKASDDRMKANKDRIAKEKVTQAKAAQAKKSNEDNAAYSKALAISTSKDKANDKMIGSWTARQKANSTLKDLADSGYKPAPVKPTTTNPATKPAPKAAPKPAVKANSYEAANKGGAMDKLVKARNSAAKGSREYAAAQNQINAAMGSKVRHTAKKIEAISSLKPAGVTKSEPTISTTGIKTTNSTIPEETKSSPATMRKSSMAKMKKKC